MTSKKKSFAFFILAIATAAVVLSGILFYQNSFASCAAFRKDLARLSQESYDSVFLSMHSSSGYTQENFAAYSALNTFVSVNEISSLDSLQRYLDKAFSSGNTINKVFLLLDPDMIWDSSRHDNAKWDNALQNGLLYYVSAHPDTDFEILLPYPSLNYWLSMDETALNDVLAVYHRFIETAYEYPNICTYYMGFENWLLANPDNYISDFDVNDIIAQKIYLICFCDGINEITPINDQILFDMLREQVTAERTSPTVYPDLSDCCLVFFGDSIIAYGEGTASIPGYITGFSHASTYNYAVGGTAASIASPDADDFPNLLPRFLSEYCTEENGIYRFTPESTDIPDKKLYFLISYGTNDYFEGAALNNPDDPYDAASYMGGLRSCITQCQTLFPDAEFIVMTPIFTNRFSNGTEPNSNIGGILTDYVDAAAKVAAELNVHCIDNYHDLGIDESNVWDYTFDGCHPNENGRILIARQIIDYIDSL